jgi:hypothetical protein
VLPLSTFSILSFLKVIQQLLTSCSLPSPLFYLSFKNIFWKAAPTQVWNKEELPEQWKESIILAIYKKGVVIIEAYNFCQLHTKF